MTGDPPSTGLLSNVFSFVSREIESFVTNAAGGPTSVVHRNQEMFTARENISAKPIARPLRRRPSMTMPGSLFPRSSSIEPDSSPRCLGEEQRRVRFATGITSPLHRDIHQDGGGEKIMAGPSHLPQDSQAKTSREAEEVAKSPLRPRAVPSVKAAVERFHVNRDEVGPSILLPSLNSSPGKGKAKDGARVDGIQKNSRYASDEQPEGHPGVAHLNSVKRKGKQRAYEALPGSKKQDASGDNCVRGKERELVTAREEHDRNEKRWERDPDVEMERVRDKVRIRKLEQEIMMLKNELSRRPLANTTEDASDHSHIPPPPPPPPPPPLPTADMMRLIGASTPLASARASLKHLAVPFEAPINPAVFGGVALRTKRHGQPTVNVPSDKMAAFLSEMKTVRLRKVSTGASAGPSGLQRRASVGGVRSSHAGSHGQGSLHQSAALKKTAASSFSSLEDREEDARTGEKRKRDPDSGTQTHDSLREAIMRQSIALSQSSSFASTSSSSSAQASRIPPNSSSFSHSYPPTSYIYLANQTWPPIPTTETDLTTPSLCSDNDHEKEDTSLDDRIPSTPPNTQTRQALRENSNREIIDVDMEADDGEHPIQPKSVAPRLAVSPIRRLNDVFEKRPPSSPMPAPSPHRPRPPARSSGKTSARSGCDDDRPEDEDPLPLFDIEVLDPPQSALSPAPSCDDSKHVREPSVIRSETSSRSSRNQRRQTLDQELRDAEERSAAQEDGDFEDIVYIGVGTKSKRQGFLAHGGAGGASVFMGVGYVEGAGEEEGEASWAEY